jgi:aminopeptidase N
MKLFVEPDFNDKSIHCFQDLKLQCLIDIDESVIKLDSVNLNVKKILYRDSENIEPTDELPFIYTDERLITKLPKFIKKGLLFFLQIEYSASPERGFHFITPDIYHPDKQIQAWTQGQMIESKFWFPCIDDPQIKFPREVSVSVPNEFIVVSNGELQEVSTTKDHKKIYTWKDANPDSVYLTSIVVGKFAEIIEHYARGIELLYYVPLDKQDRAERSFKGTANMVKFFESYFDTLYPYTKYAQTTVQDFEYGGMENTTCTTLPDEILLDEKGSLDDYPINFNNSARSVVTHELAHQWFGDLITCKEWSHIWLNEGFATYCEALYVEHVDGKDQFQRYMDVLSSAYFDESCQEYRRPIVTSKYKYPDELFDAHSYKKGAWVLHMLRNIVSDQKFKIGLKKYLKQFKNQSVETSDLRKVMEEISGQDLELFFKQWVYTEGHPELEIEFIVEDNLVRITQLRKPFFEFKLDIRVAFSNSNTSSFEFLIKSQQHNDIKIPLLDKNGVVYSIEWFSIDPELKILKEVKSFDVPPLMLLSQISNGITVSERRQALSMIDYKRISEQNLEDRLIQILKDRIINDYFGVSTKAVGALGQIKSQKALDALLECLDSKVIKNMPNGEGEAITRWIVNALSGYTKVFEGRKRDDIINILEKIARHGAKSYHVEMEALISFGDCINDKSFKLLSEAVEKPNTFNDIIPTSAIVGLSKYSSAIEKINSSGIDEGEKIHLKLLLGKAVDILIKKTQRWNSNIIRTYAVDGLKAFLLDGDNELRNVIFKVLINSLDDKWPDVRKKSLAILETTFSPDDKVFEQEIIDQLINKVQKMVELDLSYEVRRIAEFCLLAIRGKHLKKMRTIHKTKVEMSKYMYQKVEVRTKKVFGPTLRLNHTA